MRKKIEHIIRELSDLGLPTADSEELLSSTSRFEDGAAYRIEIPTINSSNILEALLNESIKVGLKIHRITETIGICRHNKREINRYVELCKQYGCQLYMSPGPRANYDIGASARSTIGSFVGYRLRGQNQFIYAMYDIFKAIDHGVKGFVVYDEGLLQVLGELRKRGKIPEDISLKVSAHCGHGNSASIKLLESLGANSINPVRDLPLPVLHAIRKTVSIPLDCHTDTPPSSGGINRFNDAPSFVQMLAPVYLKCGNSIVASHGLIPTSEQARAMANLALAVCEIINENVPHNFKAS